MPALDAGIEDLAGKKAEDLVRDGTSHSPTYSTDATGPWHRPTDVSCVTLQTPDEIERLMSWGCVVIVICWRRAIPLLYPLEFK